MPLNVFKSGFLRYLPPCQRWQRTWCKAGSVPLPLGRLCNLGRKTREKETFARGQLHTWRELLGKYWIPSKTIIGVEIDWHPVAQEKPSSPTGLWTESKKYGKLRKRKKKIRKNPKLKKIHGKPPIKEKTDTSFHPNAWSSNCTHWGGSFYINELTVGRRLATLCLQLTERQDPGKCFELLQKRAPRCTLHF